jgi:hypothetical protein
VGKYSSIAVDMFNGPHIAYQDTTNEDLKYMRKVGTTPKFFAFSRYPSAFSSVALWQLYPDVYPRIAYQCDLGLCLVFEMPTGWYVHQIDQATSNSFGGLFPSVDLDPGGLPQIAYYDRIKQGSEWSTRLRYARYDGYGWNLSTIEVDDASVIDSAGTSLAIDSQGHRHIAYYHNSSGDLRYALHNGSAWLVETVDSQGVVGGYPSLALDEAERPHISYYDASSGDLLYAVRAAKSFMPLVTG